jgi:hypothetical protein
VNEEFIIKKQAHFDETLAEVVPQPEWREEVEKAIRFAAQIPGMGKYVGDAAPVAIPIFGIPIRRSAFNPPLIAYYCKNKNTIILMDVRLAPDTEE